MNSAPRPADHPRDRAAAWRVVLSVAFALAAVLLVGLWIDTNFGASWPGSSPQATAVVRQAEARIVFSGVGSQTTARFFLAGGTYRGEWSAWGEAAEFPPCTHSAELLAVDLANAMTAGGHVTDLANRVSVRATGASDASDINILKPGEYYLDVTSACSWQIALSPKL